MDRIPFSLLMEIWGKTYDYREPLPLICHLLETAAVCHQLQRIFNLPTELPPEWIDYLVALHDIGKADAQFQCKDENQKKLLCKHSLYTADEPHGFRHWARSGEWIRKHLEKTKCWGQNAADVAAATLCGHHGEFNFEIGDDPDSEQIQPDRWQLWETIRERLAAELWDVFTPPPYYPKRFEDASRTGLLLSGLIVFSDWIASNETLFRHPGLPYNDNFQEYFQAACSVADRVVDSLNLASSCPVPQNENPQFNDLWPDLGDIRPLQKTVETLIDDKMPVGLVIIEAPTGEGKSEAALLLSEHWKRNGCVRGLYFALPTEATSNQMHTRVREFIKRIHPEESVRLVHGRAWLLDKTNPVETAEKSSRQEDTDPVERIDWFRPSKRALLATNGVGTIDQALMAALNVKFGFLRLFGLASKVLIVDEVHAYDAYMSTILKRLLEWCRALGIPVILLSATLAEKQKRELLETYLGCELEPSFTDHYPLITVASNEQPLRQISFEADSRRRRSVNLMYYEGRLDDSEFIADLALQETAQGGCAVALMNTVRGAQEVFVKLKERAPAGVELYLYHARFRAWRRAEIEDKVKSLFGKGESDGYHRPARSILVATQVVEQSLDVDFDVIISQLAPIDFILQRAGRLHRHERGKRPTGIKPRFHLLTPPASLSDLRELGATGIVYQPALLLRTITALRGREKLNLPEEYRELVEGVYGKDAVCEGFPLKIIEEADKKLEDKKADDENGGRLHLIAPPLSGKFSLAYTNLPVEETEDGERNRYFYAQTRVGDDSVTVIMLDDDRLLEAAMRETPPDIETQKSIFLNKVNLPVRWFKGAYERSPAILNGAKWLRKSKILPLSQGCWRTQYKNSIIHIEDNLELGVKLIMEDKNG